MPLEFPPVDNVDLICNLYYYCAFKSHQAVDSDVSVFFNPRPLTPCFSPHYCCDDLIQSTDDYLPKKLVWHLITSV